MTQKRSMYLMAKFQRLGRRRGGMVDSQIRFRLSIHSPVQVSGMRPFIRKYLEAGPTVNCLNYAKMRTLKKDLRAGALFSVLLN